MSEATKGPTAREDPVTARETCFDGYTPSVKPLAKRRCDNCESWRKKKGIGDFSCKHMKGYKEAPASVKRSSIIPPPPPPRIAPEVISMQELAPYSGGSN